MIDARAPRFGQAVTGLVALLGAVFGWPLAWAIMSAQMLMGLTLLARKYGISVVPTVVAVAGDGTVLERLVP